MIEIRKLPVSRWKDMRKLRLESLKESPLAFGSTVGEDHALKESEWKKRMRGAYFALADDVPVGMIVCAFNKDVKFRHVAEIYSFYVREDSRGKGVGSGLIGRALRMAQRKKDVVKVRLYVNRQQRTALRMYFKTGFEVVGTLNREMKVGGRFYTMLVMEKRIR